MGKQQGPIPESVLLSRDFLDMDLDSKVLLWFMARQEAEGTPNGQLIEPDPEQWALMTELAEWVKQYG